MQDRRGHFMSRNPRIGNQRIQTAKGIQIASTEAHHSDLQQEVSAAHQWFGNHLDRSMPWLVKYYCLHVERSSPGLAIKVGVLELSGEVPSTSSRPEAASHPEHPNIR